MDKTVFVADFEHVDYWHAVTDCEKLEELVTQRFLRCFFLS